MNDAFQSIPIMFALKDVNIMERAPKELLLEKHADFIQSYERKKEDYVRLPCLYCVHIVISTWVIPHEINELNGKHKASAWFQSGHRFLVSPIRRQICLNPVWLGGLR